MNKTKFFLPLIFILMYSCSDNLTETKVASTTESNVTTISKVRGDNKYDVLGFGCDITGDYLNSMGFEHPVLDIDSLLKYNYIDHNNPVHTDVVINSGITLKTLTEKLTKKLSATASIPFSGGIFTGGFNTEFTTTNTISTKYSYAYVDVNSYYFHCGIKKYTDISVLQKYLSADFRNDLLTKSCDQIIGLYGTHVYTDIYTGGQLRCKYKSAVLKNSDEQTVSYGANAGVKDLCGYSASTTYTKSSSAEFTNEHLDCTLVGGSGGAPFTWTPGSGVTFNFDSWCKSVSELTPHGLQLIDVADNSLIAIYEFVVDPAKKAALKTAVDNYIISKAVTVVEALPFYRFNRNKSGNCAHLYTTDLSESAAFSGTYEWVEGYVYPGSCNLPNTVTLYRYYRKSTNDHFYTTNWNELGNSKNGWTYDGHTYKVYSSQMPNTQPLYQYWDGKDHFYTTNKNELGAGSSGFTFEKIACYVL